ncbi:MAG TPA: molybdopterin-binding protein [Chitinophagaceae bacterium]|nr:molybdopterin-binding protein [Chitinophagaceae bacterium]
MRSILYLVLTFTVFSASAQKENIPTTENFSIEGKVKKSLTVSLADLSSYKSYSIDSIVITNHLGERRSTLKNVKGILLKDILNKVEIDSETPKVLSEYYFVCIASDNYKVVFSWNEIFNNDTGKYVYIITAQDGKPAITLDNRIALVSSKDQMTGRRYVKGLQKIIIERVK